MLDDDYRPLRDPSAELVRPKHPERLRHLMDAFAMVALILDGKVKAEDANTPVPRRKRKRSNKRSGRS